MPLPPRKTSSPKVKQYISGFGMALNFKTVVHENSRATQLYTENSVVSMIWGITGGKESSLKTRSNTFELDFVCLLILSTPSELDCILSPVGLQIMV